MVLCREGEAAQMHRDMHGSSPPREMGKKGGGACGEEGRR